MTFTNVYSPKKETQHVKKYNLLQIFNIILNTEISIILHGTPVSSTSKTDRHDIAKILLKVALNTINPNPLKSFLIIFTLYKRE
jgi:hypothetical protein